MCPMENLTQMQLQLYRYTSDEGDELERVKFFDFEQSQPGFYDLYPCQTMNHPWL